MNKHIFCDLDGTLLINFKEILDEDIEALLKAQKNGYTISIATGRLDYEIKMLMQKYGFHGYRISQNGAIVFDDNDELIYEKTLEEKDVITILEALQGQNIIVFFQTIDSYFIEKKLPIVKKFEKSQQYIKYIEKPNIMNELNNYHFTAISIWAEENDNINIKMQLDKVLPKHIESYISSKYTIDITSRDNSKGMAISELCKVKGISLDDIVVIGDSQNDISMFNITSNSFVMAQADSFVKSKAKNVVQSVKDVVKILMG